VTFADFRFFFFFFFFFPLLSHPSPPGSHLISINSRVTDCVFLVRFPSYLHAIQPHAAAPQSVEDPEERERRREERRLRKLERAEALERAAAAVGARDLTEAELEMVDLGLPVAFDSTKGREVPGNALGGAKVKPRRGYRQYMNRKGGFNKPLDNELKRPVAT
jgi:hypothetical protein